MNSFYMTLVSDSSLTYYPHNTQAAFKTKLTRPIHIQKGDWEMGVVELIHPSEIYTIHKEESQFFLVTHDPQLMVDLSLLNSNCKEEGMAMKFPLCIPDGVYTSPEHLVSEINAVIQSTVGDTLHKHHVAVDMAYSKTAKRIKFARKIANTKVALRFAKSLLIKLGVQPDQLDSKFPNNMDTYADIFPNDNKVFVHDVDLYSGINHMMIYSDLADYSLVGDVEAPLLRVVPFQESHQIHVHQEFLNVHYVPVARSSFEDVEINIRGDTGDLIHFAGGKTMVKLHFRKKTPLF